MFRLAGLGISRRRWIAVPALTSVLLIVTPQALAQTAGRALVEEHCAACHAIDSAGTSPLRSAPPLRRIAEFYDLDRLTEMLQTGSLFAPHPQMPLFKFDRGSARAIIAYIRSIQP